jgi:hypothetical protein
MWQKYGFKSEEKGNLNLIIFEVRVGASNGTKHTDTYGLA